MRHLGNIAAAQTLNFLFPTHTQAGAAVAPTTAGTVTGNRSHPGWGLVDLSAGKRVFANKRLAENMDLSPGEILCRK